MDALARLRERIVGDPRNPPPWFTEASEKLFDAEDPLCAICGNENRQWFYFGPALARRMMPLLAELAAARNLRSAVDNPDADECNKIIAAYDAARRATDEAMVGCDAE